MTNDAIVTQLLEMNDGVGFDTSDLFNAMNMARADTIDEFKQKLISYMTNYKPMYLNLLCVIEEIANELKEHTNEHTRTNTNT